jgi:hypothetical protein
MVAVAFKIANTPEFLDFMGQFFAPRAPWRYTLMSGLIPALPLIIIRPFLPESPIWAQKKAAGTLRRPSFTELFSPLYARTTWITTLMVALGYGAAFGAIQQLPQIVPAMAETETAIEAAKERKQEELASYPAERRAVELKKLAQRTGGEIAANYTLAQEIGGLVGRFVLALLVVRIVSRRSLIRIFQVPGIFILPVTFAFIALNNQTLFAVGGYEVTLLHVGIFTAGLLTVAQFSFWGNYLPTAYPVHLRGTGESVAHNIGGRMIGTSFAALTSILSGLPFVPGASDAERIAYTAAAMGLFVYLGGFILSFLLPEPREEMMHQ